MPSQGGHQKPPVPLWVRDRLNDREARKWLGLAHERPGCSCWFLDGERLGWAHTSPCPVHPDDGVSEWAEAPDA